jgi:hypothetical protein
LPKASALASTIVNRPDQTNPIAMQVSGTEPRRVSTIRSLRPARFAPSSSPKTFLISADGVGTGRACSNPTERPHEGEGSAPGRSRAHSPSGPAGVGLSAGAVPDRFAARCASLPARREDLSRGCEAHPLFHSSWSMSTVVYRVTPGIPASRRAHPSYVYFADRALGPAVRCRSMGEDLNARRHQLGGPSELFLHQRRDDGRGDGSGRGCRARWQW